MAPASNRHQGHETPGDKFALTRSSRYLIVWLLALLFAALLLTPSLRTGFLGDDSINSTATPAALTVMGQTITGRTGTVFWSWLSGQGRFFPLAFYIYPLFYLINGNILLYKILMLAMILGNIALFSILVRRISRSDALGIMAVFIPTLAFQYMEFHDPLLSFAGLLQVDMFLTTGALIFFTRYLERSRRADLWVSLALYASALLTYEIVIPFFLLFIPLAIWYPARRSVRDALLKVVPFAVAALLAVAAAVGFRLAFHVGVVAGPEANAYQLSLKPLLVAGAFTKQLLGAIPLNYYSHYVIPTARAAGVHAMTPIEYLSKFPLTSLIVGLGYLGLTIAVCRLAVSEPRRSASGRNALIALACVGGGLFVLPGALIALSSKWQGDGLAWGVAYLPVYISYFGMATLTSLGVYVVIRRVPANWTRTLAIAAIALILASIGVVNFQTNRITVDAMGYMRYSREFMENAVDRGTLRMVPRGGLLAMNYPEPWDNREFYANRSLDVSVVVPAASVTPTQLQAFASAATTSTAGTMLQFPTPARAYVIDYLAIDSGTGYALVGVIESAETSGPKVLAMSVRPIALYFETPVVEKKATDSFTGSSVAGVRGSTPTSIGLREDQLHIESSGVGWVLYSVDSAPVPYAPHN